MKKQEISAERLMVGDRMHFSGGVARIEKITRKRNGDLLVYLGDLMFERELKRDEAVIIAVKR